MPYTHPSIFQESEGSKDFKLLLLDWENVGIGSGPQEIGQYLISHMDPSLRAQVEREVVEDLDLEGFFGRSSLRLGCWNPTNQRKYPKTSSHSPAEVRYLDPPNLPKTPNLRRYDCPLKSDDVFGKLTPFFCFGFWILSFFDWFPLEPYPS